MADTLEAQEQPADLNLDLTTESLPVPTLHSEAQSPTSQVTNETPQTEISSIEALKEFSSKRTNIPNEKARAKAATLSLVEQVSHGNFPHKSFRCESRLRSNRLL